jgi:hypothetical protein
MMAIEFGIPRRSLRPAWDDGCRELQHPEQRPLGRLAQLLQHDLRTLVAQQRKSFSRVLSFMKGHSLQRQRLSGGPDVLAVRRCFHLVNDPSSVAMRKRLPGAVVT